MLAASTIQYHIPPVRKLSLRLGLELGSGLELELGLRLRLELGLGLWLGLGLRLGLGLTTYHRMQHRNVLYPFLEHLLQYRDI